VRYPTPPSSPTLPGFILPAPSTPFLPPQKSIDSGRTTPAARSYLSPPPASPFLRRAILPSSRPSLCPTRAFVLLAGCDIVDRSRTPPPFSFLRFGAWAALQLSVRRDLLAIDLRFSPDRDERSSYFWLRSFPFLIGRRAPWLSRADDSGLSPLNLTLSCPRRRSPRSHRLILLRKALSIFS